MKTHQKPIDSSAETKGGAMSADPKTAIVPCPKCKGVLVEFPHKCNRCDGLGKVLVSLKYKVHEVKLAKLRECQINNPCLDEPSKAADFWRENIPNAIWFDVDKECFVVLHLNSRRRIISFALASTGILDTILVHPREVFKAAIVQGAAAVILMHNHPSGDATPSEADIKVTRDLIRAGQLLKIEVLDHVIVGDPAMEGNVKGYSSLRELGYFYS